MNYFNGSIQDEQQLLEEIEYDDLDEVEDLNDEIEEEE